MSIKYELSGDLRDDVKRLILKIQQIFNYWSYDESLMLLANTMSYASICDAIVELNKSIKELSVTLIEDHQQIREMQELRTAQKRIVDLEDQVDVLEDGLNDIKNWSKAYPLEMFPEPDWKKARELLQAGGISIDEVSAHCMRHVVEGVGRIAREALDRREVKGMEVKG